MGLRVYLGLTVASFFFAGGLVATPVATVKAQGFFDGPFSSSQYWNRDRRRSNRARFDARGWWGQQRQEIPPEVRISAPKYHTYEPDALVPASFADLADARPQDAATALPEPDSLPFADAKDQLATLKLRILPEVAAAIKAHYSKFPQLIWVENGEVSNKAREVLATLESVDRFGLSPQDYLVDVPADSFPTANPVERRNALVQFELELSARALTYVLDARRGRIDPNRISGYHDFERKDVDLTRALGVLSTTSDVVEYLERQSPDNAPFRALVDELARLRTEDEGKRVEIAEATLLKPGSASPELKNIVAAIRLMGSMALKEKHATTLEGYADGTEYGPELVNLVADFQKENGLVADGIVGRNTISALTPTSVAERVAKVELALERLRWLPRDLGRRHVFINQAAFTATYMHDGKEPLSMRVVVGQKSNQTAFFSDKIETVEYNPYWGVPKSIIVNEMIPQLYNDPSYLDQQGFEVTTASGQRVSSASVDWYGVATDAIPINVRQPPGRANALGALKILFPNKHAIYMHDTPQKHLFQRDIRAFSHGCVRLQNPRAMAAAVLDQTLEYVDSRIAQGHNDSDTVMADIPVHVAYFTAWPTPDGEVKYYGDTYDRDEYLTRAIERTDAVRHVEG